METYIPAVVNWKEEKDKDTDSSNNLLYLSLSKNYRYVCTQANSKLNDESDTLEKNKETRIYNKILLVTDQISGMTDTHALTIYKTITAN